MARAITREVKHGTRYQADDGSRQRRGAEDHRGRGAEKIAKGNTLLLDIRDGTEVQASGKAAGAVHVSRGLLEFRADPDSPTHDKNFARDKTVLIYCASGGRAALAGKLLKDMGYNEVYNIGGFKDWADSGGAIEK